MTEKRWAALGVILLGVLGMLPFVGKSLWPTTDAIVINRQVDYDVFRFLTRNARIPYGVDVSFRYSVDNVEYVYEQKGPYLGTRAEAEEIIEKYPIGHNFRAHYNPNNHSEAALPLVITTALILGLFGCFALIVVGIVGLIRNE